jgi:hypothetical protein
LLARAAGTVSPYAPAAGARAQTRNGQATYADDQLYGRLKVAETYNGYCVKCKEKRDFEGEVSVSESGRKMAKGICPVCGTKMNRILGKA